MTDHRLMRAAKFLTLIPALWPVKLKGLPLKLYNWYFLLSFSYYITLDLSLLIKAVMIFGRDWKETASNLGVTIVYIINIYKMSIIKSKDMNNLIQEIEDKENFIFGTKDEGITKIYKKGVDSAKKMTIFYTACGTISISLYYITPLLVQKQITKLNPNETEHLLIFSSWLPFDHNKHYVSAYLLQLLGGFYGYAYIVFGGAFFFSILVFCIAQLKILQYIIKNFTTYARLIQKNHKISFENAQRKLIRCIMGEHKNIITFIETLDESLNLFIFLDFVISSFQMSLLVLQIMEESMIPLQPAKVVCYFSTLTFQLFFMYWNAHGIIQESTNLAQAAFESDWINYTEDVKKYYIVFIARCQKPLCLSIGPIYKMRVEALLSIFKAIYSYVALIQQRN